MHARRRLPRRQRRRACRRPRARLGRGRCAGDARRRPCPRAAGQGGLLGISSKGRRRSRPLAEHLCGPEVIDAQQRRCALPLLALSVADAAPCLGACGGVQGRRAFCVVKGSSAVRDRRFSIARTQWLLLPPRPVRSPLCLHHRVGTAVLCGQGAAHVALYPRVWRRHVHLPRPSDSASAPPCTRSRSPQRPQPWPWAAPSPPLGYAAMARARCRLDPPRCPLATSAAVGTALVVGRAHETTPTPRRTRTAPCTPGRR